MKYYYQIEGDVRNNIGDILQGMVAKAFLPSGAEVVNREDLASINKNELGYFIANGWYMHSFDKFPPPANVVPLYISVHLADSGLLRKKSVREHFKQNSPVGCRDHKTMKLFLGWGIPAYFSGCLTTTSYTRVPVNTTGEGECLLVDNVDHPVPASVKAKLETLIGAPLTSVSHDPPTVTGTLEEYNEAGTEHMEMLLERYCKARIVITTKIHCALPCFGMGANVFMVHPVPSDPRLDTVSEFINILSYAEILKMDVLNIPRADKVALEKRKKFIADIVIKGIKTNSNPVRTQPEFSTLKSESIRKAKLYRLAVKVLLLLGIKKEQLKRVYSNQ